MLKAGLYQQSLSPPTRLVHYGMAKAPGLVPLREVETGARGGRERCWGIAMGPEEARLLLRLLPAADWIGHPVIK